MSWKKIIITVLVLGGIGGGIGLYMYNKPHKNYVKAKPEISLSATELIKAFEQDEKSANAKFLNKIIEVNGEVVDISTSKSNEIAIALNDAMFGVTLTLDVEYSLDNKERIRSVKIGDNITLKGRCDGLLTDVRLSKCSIVLP